MATGLVVSAVVAGASSASVPPPDRTGSAGRQVVAAAVDIVPYGSAGWRYKVVPTGTGAGFESGAEPAGFSDGTAAWGTGGSLCTYDFQTSWPLNTDILVRRTINLPDGTSGVEIGLAIDNDAYVYWNGQLVGSQVHEFCGTQDSLVVPIADEDVSPGDNLLAVRGVDRGDLSFLDIRVSVEGGGCNLDGSTLVIRIPQAGDVSVGRSGASVEVSGDGITDTTCGGATVNNVDRIEAYGTDGGEHLTLDLSGGPLGPGLTTEGSGTSEIEVLYDAGPQDDADDRFFIQGGTANESFTIGMTGVNMNEDADGDDVTLTDVELVFADGGNGKDKISGAGGMGTGAAYPSLLFLFGAGGADTLTGGTSFDQVDGGDGNDKLNALKTADGPDLWTGGPGIDTMIYSKRVVAVEVRLDNVSNDGSSGLDATGDDVSSDIEDVTTGRGDDLITDGGFAVPNTFKGGRGNDDLQADDGIGGNDTADGGDGTDSCTTDLSDTELNCEA